jgi:hypothetical protein
MGLRENIAVANKAVKEVKKLLPKGASNKRTDRLKFAGGIEKVIATKKGMDYGLLREVFESREQVKAARPANPEEHIAALARAALANKCGNCMEQAAVAMVIAARENVLPLDFMMFSNPQKDPKGNPLYDHAWLVIGRAAGSKLDHLKSWGPDAVWCDPWQGDDGMVYSIADFVAGKVRNTNALYKLNTVELVEAGKPDSYLRIE